MDQKKFENVVEWTIRRIHLVLGVKQKEYAREDRLHNFKVGSGLTGESPEKVLLGFMTKHIVSIYDLVNDIETGKTVSIELWDEKTLDAINYLILLRALLSEREDGKPTDAK